MRSTHTYAVLELSESAFQEIRSKLETAGYQHAFMKQYDGSIAIDLHGIALAQEVPTPAVPDRDSKPCPACGAVPWGRNYVACSICETVVRGPC